MSETSVVDGAVRPCPRCGPVEWTIIRDVDHLAAECPRCKVSYDIGWSTRGYVPEAQPCRCHYSWAAVMPLHQGHCCFFPATQTCHQTEVARWEQKRDEHRRLPGRGGREGVHGRG